MAGKQKGDPPIKVGDMGHPVVAMPARAYRPAYFLSLSVENVRCFGGRQTLDLSDGQGRPRKWTVLLGNNGVGKSTLLECLALLQPLPLATQAGALLGAPRFGAPVPGIPNAERYRRHGAAHLEVSCDAICSERALESPSSGETMRLSVAVTYGTKEPQVKASGRTTYDSIGGLVCYAYGAARRMSMAGLIEEGIQNGCASLLDEGVPLLNAEEWWMRTRLAFFEAQRRKDVTGERRLQCLLEQVESMLKVVLPGIYEFRPLEATGERVPPPIGMEVRTDYGWHRIMQLGLGHRTMIAWMVDLARRLSERYPESPDPLGEPAIALVDEIDLHLHPKWQRSLMQYLSERFRKTQFIVSAHSPLVAQAAQDANIALLVREGDQVVIRQDLPSIKGWRVDQVLTSDLFELESARSLQIEPLLAERRRILGKGTLTEADKARLAELEAEIGELPVAESKEMIEAMDIIRRAAAELKQRGNGENDPHP